MTKVNGAFDAISNAVGNGSNGASIAATAPTATGFTASGLTASALVGCVVVAGSVYGVVTANTATAVTVDRWYNFATPGGAAGTTPAAGTYYVVPGNAPAAFMAISNATSATAIAATDTALAGELTTAGLVRKLPTFGHTLGATTYTLGATWTATSADVASAVTVHRMGGFNTFTPQTGRLVFETDLSSDALLSASGDAVTVNQTVTLS